MTNSQNASTSARSASGINVVLLLLVVVAAVALFAAVAYVYTHDKTAVEDAQKQSDVVLQQDQMMGENAVQEDRTIVREDGAVVHVGTCPFEGGCGDETAVYVEKKYRAKVQSINNDVVVFLTDDNVEFTAQLATVVIEKVDLDTNTAEIVGAEALTKDAAVVINLNVDTDVVENVYVLTGTFH